MRLFPLLTAIVSLAAAAEPARADLLPSRPITFGGGRVVVSGDVAISFGTKDDGYFNLFDYSHDAFNVLTLSLSAEARANDRLSFVGRVLDEVSLREREPGPSDRHVIYPYAAFVRVQPTASRSFTVLAGRIPPVFGNFGRRDYGETNPLIGVPLAYSYPTTIRPEPPPSRGELLLNRGGGWRVRYPRATAPLGPQGLPLVNARRWDTGVSAQWVGATFEAAGAVTFGTLSQPLTDDDNGGRQIAGRIGVTPVTGFSVGVSGARGEFAADPGTDAAYGGGTAGWLPEPARSATHRQEAFGVDAEYAFGHVVVRGEVVASRWDTPFLNGDPTARLGALGTSLGARVALTPRWSVAARGDRLGFTRIEAPGGDRRTWDAPVTRVEGALGYMLRRNVRLKASYQYNWRDGGRRRTAGMAGAQLLYWF
jgi:hypothetical protein